MVLETGIIIYSAFNLTNRANNTIDRTYGNVKHLAIIIVFASLLNHMLTPNCMRYPALPLVHKGDGFHGTL